MKKYSWIVALMIALTVIFISCGADPLPPPPKDDSETFEDVDLAKDGEIVFNYINADTQKGWATDGHNEAKSKLGIKIEDLQAAKYLVVELKEGQPAGGLQLIWGGIGEALDNSDIPKGGGTPNHGWMQTNITDNTGKPDITKGVTLEGNVLKIQLSKALLRYDLYTGTLKDIKILFGYYSTNVDSLGITKAYLQISSIPPEFTPATSITITPPAGPLARSNIKLAATIAPAGTTVQGITWQIVDKKGNLKPITEVDFAPIYKMNEGFNPPVKTSTIESRSKDTIVVSKPEGGKVIVRATLKDGGEDKDKKKIDITADLEITVGPNPFYPSYQNSITVGGVKSGDRPKWEFKKSDDGDGALSDLFEAKYIVIASLYTAAKSTIATVQWTFQGDGRKC